MNITQKFLAIAGILVLACTAASNAQEVTRPRAGSPGTWRLIGSTQAGRAADHDSILVQCPFDDFRRIKFKVTNAPLNMQRMVITYDNGAPENIDVRQNIPQGGESREIDLRGVGKRSIRRIDFWYDTEGLLKGKANVT